MNFIETFLEDHFFASREMMPLSWAASSLLYAVQYCVLCAGFLEI